MTLAHVEALRLENHFLRQSATEKKSDEKDIVDMQKKYHEVIELTEALYYPNFDIISIK
jgi:hypothetical protein